MFTYVHLKSFKSFEDVTIDLTDKQGNPKKLVAIFGENGIGKSNLASAFFVLAQMLRTMNVRDLMQSLLSERPEILNEELFSKILKSKYKDLETLIQENRMISSDDPMLIEVGFLLKGRRGKYLVETDKSQLVHERLEYVLTKNSGTYYDITPDKASISTKIFEDKSAYNELKQSCNRFWGKHSFLSILLHEVEDKANDYIEKQISIHFLSVLSFFKRISCKVNFGKRQEMGGICLPRQFAGDLEEGTISAKNEAFLNKSEKILNSFFSSTLRDTCNFSYRRIKKDGKIDYKLIHSRLIAGKKRDIEIDLESTGTQNILQLLPYMMVAVDGSVVVIDEFDAGIHDLLIKRIIHSLYDQINGQLIITTHSTILMEPQLVIPKESLYVINELKNGQKEIKPVTYYDPKIHVKTNIRSQYFKGTYEGIPTPKEIDFSSLLSELFSEDSSVQQL